MTPLPKRKLSHRRQGRRRASQKLAFLTLVKCKKCGKPTPQHQMCKFCQFYK